MPSRTTRTVGRPPARRNQIIAELTSEIVRGDWAPGERLPSHAELERRFRVHNPTVQQALNRLVKAGFVETRPKRGTYVASHPPHLCRYALVFPSKPGSARHWSLFWEALRLAGSSLQRRVRNKALRFETYYLVDGPDMGPEHERLANDLTEQRLAGVIFANAPFPLAGTPLVARHGVPMVAMASAASAGLEHIGARYPDLPSFRAEAMRYLAELPGPPRRPAVLSFAVRDDFIADCRAQAAAHGLELPASHIQSPNLGPAAIRNLLALLFSLPEAQRPNALVLGDDNLVPIVDQVLSRREVPAPPDLDVVAYANFPAVMPTEWPIYRLGCDAQALLISALEHLVAKREHRPTPDVETLPAARPLVDAATIPLPAALTQPR